MDHDIAPHVLLNVNFPNRPVTDLCGVQVTTQGPRQYVDRVMKRTDPTGRDYYWLGGTVASHDSIEGTDVRAIADGKISITPLHLDLTAQLGIMALVFLIATKALACKLAKAAWHVIRESSTYDPQRMFPELAPQRTA